MIPPSMIPIPMISGTEPEEGEANCGWMLHPLAQIYPNHSVRSGQPSRVCHSVEETSKHRNKIRVLRSGPEIA